jgi:hypothetical protein
MSTYEIYCCGEGCHERLGTVIVDDGQPKPSDSQLGRPQCLRCSMQLEQFRRAGCKIITRDGTDYAVIGGREIALPPQTT